MKISRKLKKSFKKLFIKTHDMWKSSEVHIDGLTKNYRHANRMSFSGEKVLTIGNQSLTAFRLIPK